MFYFSQSTLVLSFHIGVVLTRSTWICNCISMPFLHTKVVQTGIMHTEYLKAFPVESSGPRIYIISTMADDLPT